MASIATKLLLLLGVFLVAQKSDAQFDYNTTLLGTVSTFINVSTIPGDVANARDAFIVASIS